MRELTVGEVKKFLENYSDDTKFITVSSNYELRRSLVDAMIVEKKVKKVRRDFVDDFDQTRYSKEVYVVDDEGEDVILIMGR